MHCYPVEVVPSEAKRIAYAYQGRPMVTLGPRSPARSRMPSQTLLRPSGAPWAAIG
ncbi:hypothetical protein QO017_002821 [Methylobacterium gregans]|nr:hypothetical protein [Methylobacterium gregans]